MERNGILKVCASVCAWACVCTCVHVYVCMCALMHALIGEIIFSKVMQQFKLWLPLEGDWGLTRTRRRETFILYFLRRLNFYLMSV